MFGVGGGGFGPTGGTLSMLAIFALASGCESEPSKPAKYIVLIVADTLRADHLGVYGYDRAVSPQLDRFAAQATLYRRAIASSPWTLPSHASLFTGLASFRHGAHAFFVSKPWLRNAHPLHESYLTIAEALQARGYQTAAFVANAGFLDRSMKLDQGFDLYHVQRLPAARHNAFVFSWLERHRAAPFFLFVNYMDTHRHYNTRPRPGLLAKPARRDTNLLDRLEKAVLPGTDPVPRDLVQAVVDQYDTSIAHVDEAIGDLLTKLRELSLYEESLIIVTSDHGEYFGEHHLVEHFLDVYQEGVWVPLIVKRAHQTKPESNDTLISSMHIPNLIARQLPHETAAELSELFSASPDDGNPVISEGYYSFSDVLNNPNWAPRFSRIRRAVYEWPYKLIHSTDGAHELYDLESDPREQTNLARTQPAVVARLTHDLSERLEAAGIDLLERHAQQHDAIEPPLSDAQAEELRALGYAE